MHIQIRDRHIYDFANESHDMLGGERARLSSLISWSRCYRRSRFLARNVTVRVQSPTGSWKISIITKLAARGPITRSLSRGDCKHFDGDNSSFVYARRTRNCSISQLITLKILRTKIKSDVSLFRLSIFDSAGDVPLLAPFSESINDQRWILIALWGF